MENMRGKSVFVLEINKPWYAGIVVPYKLDVIMIITGI